MLAIVLGVVLGVAAPSYAACVGTACDNKNPETEGCSSNGLSTPRESFLDSGKYTLQLRKSSGCRAAWARVVRDDQAAGTCPVLFVRVEQQKYQNVDGSWYWVTVRVRNKAGSNGGCTGATWSYMAPNESDRHRACFATAWSTTPPSSGWRCTSYDAS
ncbi:DUF2690 domain-containing protein [Micromonospora sp. NPDC049891]|uniref:DUF2690 domain-containing protein n=1 Tax=Micromonospora sp. NPDC049891 TaxID=3155655 RepID=UPI0033DB0FD5